MCFSADVSMASAGVTEQDIKSKIEETRERFKKEYVKDSGDRYDRRDVDRLQTDDTWVDAYLTWRNFVVDNALTMIDESFQWRKEYKVNDIAESCVPRWTFETGAIYLHGHDKEGSKLLWFNVRLHVKDAKTVRDKKSYLAFWLERHVRREPGVLVTVVFDMSDSGISNIDLDFVKYVISCFRIYYPKLLSKMVMYEMPWIMNAAWKIVKSWLDPVAIARLKFVSKAEVQTFISTENLPPHMGGTDSFKYSYPPLPDDNTVSENGLVDSLDENSKMEEALVPKKE